MAARQQVAARPDRGRKPMLITIDEAAQYLRFHPSTVYRLARRGELPAVKVGKQWRLDREVLDNWLRANTAIRSDGGPRERVASSATPGSDSYRQPGKPSVT